MLECYVGLEDYNRAKLTMHVLIQMTNKEDEKSKLRDKLSKMPEKIKKKNLAPIEDIEGMYCLGRAIKFSIYYRCWKPK